MDEYEIDCAMLDALENAKPCKNAPIEPVEEESDVRHRPRSIPYEELIGPLPRMRTVLHSGPCCPVYDCYRSCNI